MNNKFFNKFKNNFVNIMSSIGILLVMFLLTLNRGGFYMHETSYATISMCIIGICIFTYKCFSDKEEIKFTILDWLFLGLFLLNALIYGLGAYTAKEDAIYGISKCAMLYVMYNFAKNVLRDPKCLKIVLNGILGFTLFVAIAGIDQLSLAILPKISDINYTTEHLYRLSSIFQYANVAAVFIGIGLFISKYLEYVEEKINFKVAYNVISYVLLLAMFMTQSRIAIALSIILIFVSTFLNADKSYRNIKLVNSLFYIAYTAVFYCVIYNFIRISASYDILIFTAVSIIPYFICAYSTARMYPYFIEELKNTKSILKIGGIVLGIFFLLGIIVYNFDIPVTINNDSVKEYIVKGEEINFTMDISNGEYTKGKIKVEILDSTRNLIKSKEYPLSTRVQDKLVLDRESKFLKISFSNIEGEFYINKFTIDNKNKKLQTLIIPNDIVARVMDIFHGSESMMFRKMYAKDCFRLFLKSPIIGMGEGTFKNAYQSVQKEQYISSQSHSFILDILINYGLCGMAIFILMVYAVYKRLYVIYKNADEKESFFSVTLGVIIAFMVLHSALDLDMSFLLILSMLSVFAGFIELPEYKTKKELSKELKYIIILLIILPQLYANGTYKLAAEMEKHTTKEFKYFNKSRNEILEYENIVDLASSNYSFRANLAERYTAYIQILSNTMSNGTTVEKVEARKELKRVIPLIKENLEEIKKQNPYNKYALQKYATLYFRNFANFSTIMGTDATLELEKAIKACSDISRVGLVNENGYAFAYESLVLMNKELDAVKVEKLQEAVENGKKMILKEMNLLRETIVNNYTINNIEYNNRIQTIIDGIENYTKK